MQNQTKTQWTEEDNKKQTAELGLLKLANEIDGKSKLLAMIWEKIHLKVLGQRQIHNSLYLIF